MNADDMDSEARPHSRKPIILIGAPSGAGKTVLVKRLLLASSPFSLNFAAAHPTTFPSGTI